MHSKKGLILWHLFSFIIESEDESELGEYDKNEQVSWKSQQGFSVVVVG